MVAEVRVTLRAVSFLLACLFPPLVHAKKWAPREDAGVAAVDMRTGKVLWEAWQGDDVPKGATKEAKAAVKSLLAAAKGDGDLGPNGRRLPEAPVKGLTIKNSWPTGGGLRAPSLSVGKGLVYYRHPQGVIALDRKTKAEAWRLLTRRYPYPSEVLEADGLALIHIGSHVPQTINAVLLGGRDALPKLGPRTAKQRAAAAILLHRYGDGYLRPELRKQLDQLRKADNGPDAKVAAKA